MKLLVKISLASVAKMFDILEVRSLSAGLFILFVRVTETGQQRQQESWHKNQHPHLFVASCHYAIFHKYQMLVVHAYTEI